MIEIRAVLWAFFILLLNKARMTKDLEDWVESKKEFLMERDAEIEMG